MQKFERGMMLWRSDTSTIWVLSNQGQAKAFSPAVYSPMRDNPIKSSPTGLVPALGFGKVWGSYTVVRQMIGSPTTAEHGVSMTIEDVSGSTIFTQPDGVIYNIGRDGRWTSSRPDVVLNPRIEQFSTSSDVPFVGENLTISWVVKDTEGALVDVYDGNSTVSLFPFDLFPASGNVTIVVPALTSHRLRIVVTAANRTVGNYDRRAIVEKVLDVYSDVPLNPRIEQFSTSNDVPTVGEDLTISWVVKDTEGATVDIYDGNSTVSLFPFDLFPVSGSVTISVPHVTHLRIVVSAANRTVGNFDRKASVEKILAVSPAGGGVTPRVEMLSTTSEAPSVGEYVTISWFVRGTEGALVEIYDGDSMVNLFAFDLFPANGSTTISVPALTSQKLRIVVTAANRTVGNFDRKASAEKVLTVASPQATTITTYAAYQAFEHGYMIWRADNDDVYVFGPGVTTFDSTAGMPDNPHTMPPDGLIAPANSFGRAWASNEYLRDALGWATGQEMGYQATISYQGNPETLTEFTISLPGGSVITLYNGGGAWHVR